MLKAKKYIFDCINFFNICKFLDKYLLSVRLIDFFISSDFNILIDSLYLFLKFDSFLNLKSAIASDGKNINHVALYMGDSQYIHAPSSGDNVRIDNITSNYFNKNYYSARRLIY